MGKDKKKYDERSDSSSLDSIISRKKKKKSKIKSKKISKKHRKQDKDSKVNRHAFLIILIQRKKRVPKEVEDHLLRKILCSEKEIKKRKEGPKSLIRDFLRVPRNHVNERIISLKIRPRGGEDSKTRDSGPLLKTSQKPTQRVTFLFF